jgi:hypothetical protein
MRQHSKNHHKPTFANCSWLRVLMLFVWVLLDTGVLERL